MQFKYGGVDQLLKFKGDPRGTPGPESESSAGPDGIINLRVSGDGPLSIGGKANSEQKTGGRVSRSKKSRSPNRRSTAKKKRGLSKNEDDKSSVKSRPRSLKV